MYEPFYNLSEKPFTLLPDPGFLYMSEKHRMALTLLEYGLMNHAGFTVISGDIGAGKTTLIRHVLNNMDREHTVGLITNTHRDFGELLQWTLLAFNLEHSGMNKVEMYQRFVDFIIDEYAHNRRTVLIVDEAQNMAPETLEELRMLSNINADKNQALQVVLVGQRELRETLQRPDLAQFAQRISVDYHLQSLSESETAGYIRHRMEVAGGDPDTFTEMACKAIHRYSGGVPRLINLLCDTSLVYGFADQKHRIDARMATAVAREKQAGGIFPTFDEAGLEEIVEPETPPEESVPAQLEETGTESMEASSWELISVKPEPTPDTIEPVEMEQPATPEHQEAIEVATQIEEPVIDPQPAQPTPAGDPAAEPESEENQGTLSEAEHRWQRGQPQKKSAWWLFWRRRA